KNASDFAKVNREMQDFYANSMEICFYTPVGVVARTCRSYETAEYAPPTKAKNRFTERCLYCE
ncbi:MAG: hypothetical protein IKA87_02435, partial [Lentisphaeria bacterium]|nr:hypothetical protein [Lentisphaeria bacterium]